MSVLQTSCVTRNIPIGAKASPAILVGRRLRRLLNLLLITCVEKERIVVAARRCRKDACCIVARYLLLSFECTWLVLTQLV